VTRKSSKCSREDPRTRSLASIHCGPEDYKEQDKEQDIITLLGMPQQPRRHKVYVIMPYVLSWFAGTNARSEPLTGNKSD
jgi:hypothetical protein